MKIIPLGVGGAFTERFFHNNYIFQLGEWNLLVDAGATLRYSLSNAGFSPTDIHHIFITHFHSDHVAGLEELLQRCYFRMENGRHTPHKPTLIMLESQKKLFDSVLTSGLYNQHLALEDYCHIHYVPNVSEGIYETEIGSYIIEMIDTTDLHTLGMHSFAFKIYDISNQANLLFTSDINHLEKSGVREKIDHQTIAIFQDFFYEKNPVHADFDQILSYYSEADYKKIYLMHYPDRTENWIEQIQAKGMRIVEQAVPIDFNVVHERHPRLPRELTSDQLLTMIFSYAAKIANEKSLDQLLMLMADMGREMILADRCTLWLLDRGKNELWTRVAHGLREVRIPSSTGLAGYAVQQGESIFIDDAYLDPRFNQKVDQETGYRTRAILAIPIRNNEGEIIGVYQAINKLTDSAVFSKKDVDHLTLAASYAGKSIEAAILHNEIEETQKEIIFTMGEIGEVRSRETGNHVKRVAEYSYVLALKLGFSAEEAELIKIASPMHDIGKVAIPDEILKKPGKLDASEFEVIKSHSSIGYNLLKNSTRRILQAAATIAHEHHEKWDGTGYPNGLKEQNIHIYGRITAVADVFDALGSERVYKPAWELERIIRLFQEERGKHFEPALIDVFLENIDDFVAIKKLYQD